VLIRLQFLPEVFSQWMQAGILTMDLGYKVPMLMGEGMYMQKSIRTLQTQLGEPVISR
jgi:hypothetical protein